MKLINKEAGVVTRRSDSAVGVEVLKKMDYKVPDGVHISEFVRSLPKDEVSRFKFLKDEENARRRLKRWGVVKPNSFVSSKGGISSRFLI